MACKLIAFDLDGTLLDDRKQIPPENIAALLRAHEAGILLVPATGRILKGMPEQLTALGVCRYFIFSNGATVYDLLEDRCLHTAGIDPELAVRVCEYMDRLPVLYDCYRDGFGYMTEAMYEEAFRFFDSEPEILKLVKRLRTPVPDLKENILEVGRPLEKLQMYFDERHMDERLRQLRVLPEHFPDLITSSSTKNNVEINSREAGKDHGLRYLCQHLGIELRDTVAFGDGLNDLSMLRAAGRGCAMDNAADAVKESADAVIGSNLEAGVGKEIMRILAEET